MRLFATLTLVAISLPASAVTLPQTPVLPRYEPVETLGIADVHASLAIDPISGFPAIVFIDKSGVSASEPRAAPVQRRWYDGWVWRRETLGTLSLIDQPEYRHLLYAADELGRRHVLMLETNAAGSADDALVYLRRDAQGDVREVLANGSAASSVHTRLAFTVARDGRPHAAWIADQTASGGTLVVRRREESGTWTPIEVGASPGIAATPNLAATPPQAGFGDVDLIWLQSDAGMQSVRHARIDASSGVTTRNVLSTAAIVYSQHVARAPEGRAEVAVIRSAGANTFAVERRALEVGASQWSCPDEACLLDVHLQSGAVAAERVLALGPGGRRAFGYVAANGRPSVAVEDPAAATAGRTWELSSFSNPRDVAFDAAGTLHVSGADHGDHRDLSLVRLAGPWSSVRVPESGAALSLIPSALSIGTDADDAPVVYGRAGAQDPAGALWTTSPSGFVSDPLPPGLRVEQSDLIVAESGVVHLALHDGITRHVFHATRGPGAGSGWRVERVSRGDGVPAFDPRIVLGPGEMPRVLYRQAGVLAIAAPRSDTRQWLSREVASGVDGESRPRADASTEMHAIHVSWYDAAAQELRITSIIGDAGDPATPLTLSTMEVPRPPDWVMGQTAHDLVLTGDGGVAVAHSQTVGGGHNVGYSFHDREQWRSVGSDPTGFGGEAIRAIAIDSLLGSARQPRIAWVQGTTTATQTLHYAEKRPLTISWNVEDFGAYTTSQPRVDLSTRGQVRIAYDDNGALRIARRAETIDAGGDPQLPRIAPGALSWCLCHVFFAFTNCAGWDRDGSMASEEAKSAAMDPSRPQAVLRGVRARFESRPAGRYYLQLFGRHAEEIIRLTLEDPTRLQERMRTLSDLLPGLAAFANGDGSAYRLDPLMIRSARRVWEGWAAAGSPELATAVEAELARTNQLEDFSGLDFEQWFDALEAGPALDRVFAHGFESSR